MRLQEKAMAEICSSNGIAVMASVLFVPLIKDG